MSVNLTALRSALRDPGKKLLAASPLISVGAVSVALTHAIWPDLTIDTITLGLMGIAIVPWLGHIISAIELPGGLRVTYREIQKLRQQVDTQGAQIEENRWRSQSAITQAETAANVALRIQTPVTPGTQVHSPDAQMRQLMEEYDETRRRYKSGDHRTALMTDVITRMIALAPRLPNFDVAAAMFKDGGERLAAYAHLYALPDPTKLGGLTRSLREPEPGSTRRFRAQPFEQYWGLLALHKVLGRAEPSTVPPSVVDDLTQLRSVLPQGSDRAYELSRCLRLLGLE